MPNRLQLKRLFFISLSVLVLALPAQAGAVKLGAYNVDLEQTSVSGISSGGFMTVQFHLAHSASIQGVGVFAGGPYDCAEDSINGALNVCMLGKADADASIENTDRAFTRHLIDDPAHVANAKIWLFSGYNDGVVKQPTMDALYEYYKHYTDAGNIFYKDDTDAGHAQITLNYGNNCAVTGGNFINDCDYDGAGLLLQQILGRLNPKQTGALGGKIVEFDQSEFVAGNALLSGMSNTAYLYVPAACAAGEPCWVHIAFHGCLQYAGRIGDAFYRHAGYNEWADSNNIIVLYPQTVATQVFPFPTNPKGCWDWWGYTDAKYATQQGKQISAVWSMLQRLASGATPGQTTITQAGTPQNLVAIDSSDDAVNLVWSPDRAASGFNVYRAESATGEFVKLNSAPVTGASYADSGLSPGTEYFYAVSSFGPEGESERAGPVSIATAAAPPVCDPYFTDNVTHTLAGRAYTNGIITFAKGSNEDMGFWNIFTDTNLYREGDSYRVGTCPED